jgi:hypothetical protein
MYRVTQRSKLTGRTVWRDYRWKWAARCVAWLVSGRGALGSSGDAFTTEVTEVS